MEFNENVLARGSYITILPLEQIGVNFWKGEVIITNTNKSKSYTKGDIVYYLDSDKKGFVISNVIYHLVLYYNIASYEEKYVKPEPLKDINPKLSGKDFNFGDSCI